MSENRKVVIFDCDGTIVDTFKLIEQVVIKTFKEILPDYYMSETEAHTFFGPFLNDSFKYMYISSTISKSFCLFITPNA